MVLFVYKTLLRNGFGVNFCKFQEYVLINDNFQYTVWFQVLTWLSTYLGKIIINPYILQSQPIFIEKFNKYL